MIEFVLIPVVVVLYVESALGDANKAMENVDDQLAKAGEHAMGGKQIDPNTIF